MEMLSRYGPVRYSTNPKQLWERVCRWLAWHVPSRVAYWVYIRIHSFATVQEKFHKNEPDDITWGMALDVWSSENCL